MIYVLVRFTGYNYFGSFHRLYIQADITGIVGQALGQVVSKCITAAASSAAPPALLVMWV